MIFLFSPPRRWRGERNVNNTTFLNSFGYNVFPPADGGGGKGISIILRHNLF
ncbi:MAG: hypothetical protein LBR79_00790 [Oscillospiraceae bacterium]|nr:hypothetical protein [Oscillospiraceae bacterium]